MLSKYIKLGYYGLQRKLRTNYTKTVNRAQLQKKHKKDHLSQGWRERIFEPGMEGEDI